MSDGKYGGQYDSHDGNCFVCGLMLNAEGDCSLCDSIEAPLLKRIEELEKELKWLQREHVRVCSLESDFRNKYEALREAAKAAVDSNGCVWPEQSSHSYKLRTLAKLLEDT